MLHYLLSSDKKTPLVPWDTPRTIINVTVMERKEENKKNSIAFSPKSEIVLFTKASSVSLGKRMVSQNNNNNNNNV